MAKPEALRVPRIVVPSTLFVSEAMSRHPTLAGERIAGSRRRVSRRLARGSVAPIPMRRAPRPPWRRRIPDLAPDSAWLLACATVGVAAVIVAGLLVGA